MTYFQPAEFFCKCGRAECDAPKAPSRILVLSLDRMREMYGRPLIVTSGLRCASWNAAQGGVPGSEHMTGEGADLACPDSRSRWSMLDAARHAGFARIGIGKTFLHVGVSSTALQNVVWTYYPESVMTTTVKAICPRCRLQSLYYDVIAGSWRCETIECGYIERWPR